MSASVRGLSPYCTQTNVLYVDSVCLLPAWLENGKVCSSGWVRVLSALILISFSVSFFFVEFARLTRRKIFILYFIENLQSCTCLWNAHCADYKNRNKKGDAIDFFEVI